MSNSRGRDHNRSHFLTSSSLLKTSPKEIASVVNKPSSEVVSHKRPTLMAKDNPTPKSPLMTQLMRMRGSSSSACSDLNDQQHERNEHPSVVPPSHSMGPFVVGGGGMRTTAPMMTVAPRHLSENGSLLQMQNPALEPASLQYPSSNVATMYHCGPDRQLMNISTVAGSSPTSMWDIALLQQQLIEQQYLQQRLGQQVGVTATAGPAGAAPITLSLPPDCSAAAMGMNQFLIPAHCSTPSSLLSNPAGADGAPSILWGQHGRTQQTNPTDGGTISLLQPGMSQQESYSLGQDSLSRAQSALLRFRSQQAGGSTNQIAAPLSPQTLKEPKSSSVAKHVSSPSNEHNPRRGEAGAAKTTAKSKQGGNSSGKKKLVTTSGKDYKLGAKKRPKRSLSAYNIFFREERERLLCELAKKAKEGQPNAAVETRQQEQQKAKNEPEKQSTVAASSSSGGGGKRRAPHRMISFEEMGKIIGARWKELSDEERVKYQTKALHDKQRYEEERDDAKRRQKQQKQQAPSTTNKTPKK